jgi:hypothetical protein
MAEEGRTEEVPRWTAKMGASLVISLLIVLRGRPKEEQALHEEEINRLQREVGEVTHGPRHTADGELTAPYEARGCQKSGGDVTGVSACEHVGD